MDEVDDLNNDVQYAIDRSLHGSEGECAVCPVHGQVAVVEAAKPEPLAWMRLEPTWRRMSAHVVLAVP